MGVLLWTDFELFGDARLSGYECQQIMTDYKKIRRTPGFAKLRSIDTAIIHSQSIKWLGKSLSKHQGQTNVVVTHHAPSIQSVQKKYQNDIATAAYASNLENFILENKPDFWFHGHMHSSSDYKIGGCRILCNPRGYPDGPNSEFEAGFSLTL